MPKVFLYGALLLLLLTACEQQLHYDKVKWQEIGDLNSYPYRSAMLKDLLYKHKLKGLSKTEWQQLLGAPDNVTGDTLTAYYNIFTEYDVIDPDHTKDLWLHLAPDSSIKDFEVVEWKKHERK